MRIPPVHPRRTWHDNRVHTNFFQRFSPNTAWLPGLTVFLLCIAAPAQALAQTDGDGDGFCALGKDLNSDGDCLDLNENDATYKDCDDTDPNTYPGAAYNEPALLVSPALCTTDNDADGYGIITPGAGVDQSIFTAGTDCDDFAADTYPGAASIEGPTACMKDSDADGYGDTSSSSATLDATQFVAGTDCDDTIATIYPAAEETCDSVDENCNAIVDEWPSDRFLFGWDCDGDKSPQESAPFIGLAVGHDANCFITASGLVECIGSYNAPIVDLAPRCTPVAADLRPSDAIAVNLSYACMLDENHLPLCWGDEFSPPIYIGGAPSISQQKVVAGSSVACSLDGLGAINCWGDPLAALMTDQAAPFVNTSTTNDGYLDLALYSQHACAINVNEEIVCWGEDTARQVTDAPTTGAYKEVAVGAEFSCAVDNTDQISCWGNITSPPFTSGSLEIFAGGDFACAFAGDGIATCWGANDRGQTSSPDVPAEMDATSNPTTMAALGENSACIITADGGIECWGDNSSGATVKGYFGRRACGDQAPDHLMAVANDVNSDDVEDFDCDDTDPVQSLSRFWGNDGDSDGFASIGSLAASAVDCTVNQAFNFRDCDDGVADTTTEALPVIIDNDVDGYARAAWEAVIAANNGVCGLTSTGQLACSNFASTVTEPVLAFDATDAESCVINLDRQLSCTGAMNNSVLSQSANTFSSLSFGAEHYLCAIDTSGALHCFDETGPINPISGSTFTQVDAGADYACGITDSFDIECWGDDRSSGRVSAAPTSGSFFAVAVGGDHACAIEDNNAVTCWGSQADPALIQVGDVALTQITAGASHSCGLTSDGIPICWGDNQLGQLDFDAADVGYTSITTYKDTTCAIDQVGDWVCWGLVDALKSTRGDNTSAPQAREFVTGSDQSSYLACPGTSLDPGFSFDATDCDDESWEAYPGGIESCDGVDNDCDGIADNNPPDSDSGSTWYYADADEDGFGHTGAPYAKIASSGSFTCASGGSNGTIIQCWGASDLLVVAQVPPPTPVRIVDIGVGDAHACVLMADGVIQCWGDDDFNQVSDVPDLQFKSIAVGAYHTCAVKQSGGVVCWGNDAASQISGVPALVASDGEIVTSGGNHSCAVVAGSVQCWGDDASGQSTPPLTTGVRALAAGTYHTCALSDEDQNGTLENLKCWGDNTEQQTNITDPSNALDALSLGATGIVASASTSCFTFDESDGSDQASPGAVCWGRDDYNQATVPTGFNSADATGVVSGSLPLPGVRTIAPGTNHSCLIRQNGIAICYGDNTSGQAPELQRGGITSCEASPPAGYVSCPACTPGTDFDCDDTNPDTNPDATDDSCDGVDNDCANGTDDGADVRPYYPDFDGDGLGYGSAIWACSAPSSSVGLVTNDLDCNPSDVNQGMIDIYPDQDEDGFGAGGAPYRHVTLSKSVTNENRVCAVNHMDNVECWGSFGTDYSALLYQVYASIGSTQVNDFELGWESPEGDTAICLIKHQLGEDRALHCFSDIAANPIVQEMGTRTQLRKLSVGANHACAVTMDYQAECWGNIEYYQYTPDTEVLNSGGSVDGPGHYLSLDSLDVIDIDLNEKGTCAVLMSGEVACVGLDQGNGALIGPTAGNDDYTQVCMGVAFGCAANEDRVECWGNNLAAIDNAPDWTGTPNTIRDLSCGAYHACVVHENGVAECWGDILWQPEFEVPEGAEDLAIYDTPTSVTFSSIAAGELTTCGILEADGTIRCWGADANLAQEVHAAPYNCEGPDGDGLYSELEGDCVDWSDAAGVAAASNVGTASESCSDGVDNDCDGTIDSTGTWYDNDGDGYGALDEPACGVAVQPGVVENAQDCNDSDPDVNPNTSWYLDDDSDGFGTMSTATIACEQPQRHVINSADCDDTDSSVNPDQFEICNDGIDQDCDGLENQGAIIDGLVYMSDIDGDGYANDDETYLDIATSGRHTCTVNSDSSITCWGAAEEAASVDRGQISNAPADTGYSKVVVGLNHSCAIKDVSGNNELVCWGADGTDSDFPYSTGVVPSELVREAGYVPPNVIDISAGTAHTCALLTETDAVSLGFPSNLFCFGASDSSELDHGQVSEVPEGTDYIEITSGMFNACAIKGDNTMTCWGLAEATNGYPTVQFISDVAAGSLFTCGIKSTGRVRCWGDSSLTHPTTGAAINTETSVWTSIEANNQAVCALNSSNEVSCWVSDDAAAMYGLPQDVLNDVWTPPDAKFIQLSGSELGMCGLTNTNKALCWGTHTNGSDLVGAAAEKVCPGEESPGYVSINAGLDCDVNDPNTYPGAVELCDGLDNNCDSLVDNFTGVGSGTVYYIDTDEDGFGDPSDPGQEAVCAPSDATYATNTDDCDDSNPDLGLIPTWFEDADADGYGDATAAGVESCSLTPPNAGWVTNNDDCDDTDADLSPETIWYADADNDNFGDANTESAPQCEQPAGFVLDNTDCNDGDPNVSVGATYWYDGDGDQQGNPSIPADFCGSPPSNYVSNDSDCDDSNSTINASTEWHPDEDGDGYGTQGASSQVACEKPAVTTHDWVTNSDDCDDANATISVYVWFDDVDGDGYGDDTSFQSNCVQPADTSSAGGDCDDSDPLVKPGVTEACDGVDNDCDGQLDERGAIDGDVYYFDADGDGVGLARHTSIAVSQNAICALNHAGEIECWGDQPGHLIITDAPAGSDYFGIVMGGDFACAYSGPLGDLYMTCWGNDSVGETTGIPGTNDIRTGGLGEFYGCVLLGDGSIHCWGADDAASGSTSGLDYGQVADRPTDNRYVDLAVGSRTACALDYNGEIDCWGEDGGSEPTGFGYYDISCGNSSCCALHAVGEIECWGSSASGQLNAPTNTQWDWVESGFESNCAGSHNGTFTCWGAYEHDSDAGDPFWIETSSAAHADLICGKDPGGNISCAGTEADFMTAGTPEDVAWSDMRYCDAADLPSLDLTLVDGDCDDSDPTLDEPFNYFIDEDRDGFGAPQKTIADCTPPLGYVSNDLDCDDTEPAYNPNVDWSPDADADGFGDPSLIYNCQPNDPFSDVPDSTDCDDGVAAVNPSAPEICDGIDNNCDTEIDDDDDDLDLLTATWWYEDLDADGYGNPNNRLLACDLTASNFVENDEDCNDVADSIFPGASEICGDGVDQDCNGSDLACNGTDDDGDGFCDAEVCTDGTLPGDCDDADPAINPYASEQCNGIDDNCNLNIDEYLTEDFDNDGHTAVGSCEGSADDCNDFDAEIYPGMMEACNGLDDDCDGSADEGLRYDSDGDTFLAPTSCVDPLNTVFDCDDDNPDANPGLTEILGDGIDNDCNGSVDVTPEVWDDDGDCYCESTVATCVGSTNYSCPDIIPGGDCDDGDAAVNPDGIDLFNGIDDDCDGLVDNIEDSDVWRADFDNDGFSMEQGDCDDFEIAGTASVNPSAVEACNGIDDNCDGYLNLDEVDLDGDGFLLCEQDCDDNNAKINPTAFEICGDGIDNNCNNLIDENTDNDGDGFTTCNGDCNDDIGVGEKIHIGAIELCDNLDNDCDGRIDENFDVDGDGYYDKYQCVAAHPTKLDCNDNNALIHPNAPENCFDGIDNNCNGQSDEYADADGDGWDTCSGDCNDAHPYVSPSAIERCNGADDNCDGQIDEEFDLDGDGITVCTGDCNDAIDTVYIGAKEICDGLDNDCSKDPYDDNDYGIPEGEDDDLDGFPSMDCCDDTGEYESCGTDCDDLEPATHPEADEECDDGIDNNCNGDVDWDEADFCVWEGQKVANAPEYLQPRGCSDCNTLAPVSPWGWSYLTGLLCLLTTRRRRPTKPIGYSPNRAAMRYTPPNHETK